MVSFNLKNKEDLIFHDFFEYFFDFKIVRYLITKLSIDLFFVEKLKKFH
jgi:hypothetical protein